MFREGFTKAWRKDLCSDIWSLPPIYHRVWYFIRQEVEWKKTIFPTIKKFGIHLNPGQLLTSLDMISDGVAWQEYGVKRKPNKKTISTILAWLEFNEMIDIESNRSGTFISVRNWEQYQESPPVESNAKETIDGSQKKRSLDTSEEVVKKLKKLKPYIKYCEHFFENRKKEHPDKVKIITESKIIASAAEIEKLVRLDKFNFEQEIIPNVNWAMKDSFWSPVLLSLSSLRKRSKNNEMKFVNIISAKARSAKNQKSEDIDYNKQAADESRRTREYLRSLEHD